MIFRDSMWLMLLIVTICALQVAINSSAESVPYLAEAMFMIYTVNTKNITLMCPLDPATIKFWFFSSIHMDVSASSLDNCKLIFD
jgi:hypothetical protein